MGGDLPEYYFRIRDNGAFVYRLDAENRNRRLEMDHMAVANVRNGEIKPHGARELSARDLAEIRAWMEARADTLAAREMDEIRRVSEQLNMAAHWAQSRASDGQLEEVTDALLLAMHDLRSVLVRKKADRLEKPDGSP